MTSLLSASPAGTRPKVSPPKMSEVHLKKWPAIIGANAVQMAALYECNHVPDLMSSSILLTCHFQCSSAW